MGSTRWTRAAAVVAGALATVMVGVAGQAQAQPASQVQPVTGPPVGTFPEAFLYALGHPAALAPGANDYSCTPSAAHPRPVVLVHGTYLNSYDDFAELAPALQAQGYCVFAPSYGGLAGSPLQANAAVADSAVQVSGVIDDVLAATGATQVDVVGHSQGGMLPRYITKNLPNPDRIASITSLAPSNYGTTFFGILPALAAIPGSDPVVGTVLGQAVLDQRQGSPFLAQLNSDDPTPGATKYTVIETRYDEVVTPYTNAFVDGATNITLQDQCAQDYTDHLGITYDPVTIALVKQALDPTSPAPVCTYVPPLVS